MSLHKIFRSRYLILVFVSLTVIVTQLNDIQNQLTKSKQENTVFSHDLSLVFNNAIERSLLSFTYIGNFISTHLSTDQQAIGISGEENSSLNVTVSPLLYWGDDISLIQIRRLYGLSNDESALQKMMSSKKEIWRIKHNAVNGNLNLIMGKRIQQLKGNPFIEITFEVDEHSPIIPTQLNSKLLFINSDNSALLREGNHFRAVNLTEKSGVTSNQIANHPDIFIHKKSYLGYEFYQINNDTHQQYQMINVFVPKLHGTIKILMERTNQLNSIHDDINKLLLSLLGLMLLFLLTHYSSRYIKYINRVMNSDALTGLKNRYFLKNSKIKMQEKVSKGSISSYGVIALDIDYFKKVNDTYGHDVGDQVLVRFGKILTENIRKEDECYRIGGEEFVIFTPCDKKQQAISLAERLRHAVEIDNELQQLIKGGITTSLGISWMSKEQNAKESMKVADEQLYVAKKNGRNVVRFSENALFQ